MTVFVFSGQGAQKPGMGKELYNEYESARYVFDMAESIKPGIKDLCFEGTKEDLNITLNTQPCVFSVDLAAANTLMKKGVLPDMVAGFSLGEIAALAFSGVLTYEDAFKLVIKRAEFMHEETLKEKGAMAAVLGGSKEDILSAAERYGSVEPVNFNCPGQTVVAGLEPELEMFAADIKEKGAKVKMLAVSGAFHSRFMKGASGKMAEYIKDINVEKPKIPVYSNYTAKPYGDNAEDIMEYIVKQISSPVKWQESVENMIAKGAKTFIEVGEGKVLCGLISKINPGVKVLHYTDVLNDTQWEG